MYLYFTLGNCYYFCNYYKSISIYYAVQLSIFFINYSCISIQYYTNDIPKMKFTKYFLQVTSKYTSKINRYILMCLVYECKYSRTQQMI